MSDTALLEMLKIDLGITATAYDSRLTQYLENARQQITMEGVSLKDSDGPLVVMYAAWMWRKRDGMEGMPRMLRWQLNNRVMSEHMEGA